LPRFFDDTDHDLDEILAPLNGEDAAQMTLMIVSAVATANAAPLELR
jgi:hypothetical protein